MKATFLKTSIIETAEGFEALEEEWRDLYENCSTATPFQSWAWLFSWWESYGGGYEMKLVLLRDGEGLLVGALPFMIERGRWGVSRLLFIGAGMTEYLDILVREGWERKAFEAANEALAGLLGGWRVADLQQLRPEAATWNVLSRWDGPRSRLWHADYLELEAKPWEEVLASLDKKRRETARRTLRRAEKEGVVCRPADRSDLHGAVRRWILLHREYWRDRGITPEHLTGGFEAHMHAAIKRMSDHGQGELLEFWKDGEVIAADFVIIGHGFVAGFLEGANDYARKHFELNTLYMRNWIEIARSRSVPSVSLMVGEDPYKLKWKPRHSANYRGILGGSRLPWAIYSSYFSMRSMAAEYSKQDKGPRWLTAATESYRNLRYKARIRKNLRTQIKNSTTDAPRLAVAVIETSKGFEALEEEWQDLYRDCPAATPFQSWAWLFSWWESYGGGYEMKLVLLRDGEGLLVGALPFMVERRMGLSRLMLIGTGITDYLDVLAREGWQEEVIEAARGALAEEVGRWGVADFQQLRPEAAVWDLFRLWERPKTCLRQGVCPVIRIDEWERMTARLSRSTRQSARQTVRRLESEGVGCEMAGPERVEEAARRFVVLHREMWTGRDITPGHLSGKFEAHIISAARRMTEHGMGGISEFRLNGEVIASHFLITGRDFVGEMLFGATPETISRYQISSLFVWDGARVARERDIPRFDFLRGEDDYKLKWKPETIPTDRAILSRKPAQWLALVAYHVIRSKTSRFKLMHKLYKRVKAGLSKKRTPGEPSR